jgi:hypothetical protein
MMMASDATTWSVNYNHHSDDSRGVIYAPRVIIMLLENIYSAGVTNDDHYMTVKLFYSTGHRSHIFSHV